MKTEKTYHYLEPKQGSLYRQPFLKGTRIRAEILYSLTVDKIDDEDGPEPGMTPEEVASAYNLPLEPVLEAIDWCKANWDVVIADHAREDRLMEATGMTHPDYKWNPKKYYTPISLAERARIINDEDVSG